MRIHLVTACFLLTTAAASAQQKTIKGKVVDADDNAVAGIEVSRSWNSYSGKLRAYRATKTNEQGEFTLSLRWYNRAVALTAMSADRKTGGLVRVDKRNIDQPVTIKIGRLVKVQGEFTCTKTGDTPAVSVSFSLFPSRARVLSCRPQSGKLSIFVPPGKYRLSSFGRTVRSWNRQVTIDGTKDEVDLGKIDLRPTVIAEHYGKTPPGWNVAAARGVGKEVQLSDYKGKWVLLEFWGYW